jgi:Skp family chaperone for outer membrane proteins
VKRKLALIIGVAALSAAAYFSSPLWADPGATGGAAPAPVKTRICLINVSQVIKTYKKWDAYQQEAKVQVQHYEEQMKGKTSLLEVKKKEYADAKDLATKDQIEKDSKRIQRDLQDAAEQFKLDFGKKEVDQLTIIFKEIEEAARVYARARDIDLVLHYSDPFAPAQDPYNPNNLNRKLTSGALIPIYAADGMDISTVVTQMLNDRYMKQVGTAAPATAPRGN